jgi:hypothetical protein
MLVQYHAVLLDALRWKMFINRDLTAFKIFMQQCAIFDTAIFTIIEFPVHCSNSPSPLNLA